MERKLKQLIRMMARKRDRHGWLRIGLWIIASFLPLGIQAFDPFSLHTQTTPPRKPHFKTKVIPGDASGASAHSCKDPARVRFALRRQGR